MLESSIMERPVILGRWVGEKFPGMLGARSA
jgi:hypothetical protein